MFRKRIHLLLLAAAVCTSLSACLSTGYQKPKPVVHVSYLDVTELPERNLIVMRREPPIGKSVPTFIALDGVKLGMQEGGTYSVYSVDPGPHRLSAWQGRERVNEKFFSEVGFKDYYDVRFFERGGFDCRELITDIDHLPEVVGKRYMLSGTMTRNPKIALDR